jgi:hypothetical protein
MVTLVNFIKRTTSNFEFTIRIFHVAKNHVKNGCIFFLHQFFLSVPQRSTGD